MARAGMLAADAEQRRTDQGVALVVGDGKTVAGQDGNNRLGLFGVSAREQAAPGQIGQLSLVHGRGDYPAAAAAATARSMLMMPAPPSSRSPHVGLLDTGVAVSRSRS